MRKSVAIGIAGVTAVVVAAWRQVQRDNTMPDDVAVAPGVPVDQSPAGPDLARNPSTATPAGDIPDVAKAPSVVDESSTKAELYEVATDLGIDGRSKMNKNELLQAIRAAS